MGQAQAKGTLMDGTMQDGTEQDDDHIQPNLRPLRMIEIIAAEDRPLTAADFCDRLGLPKPTVHRLVQMLEAEGFIERDLSGRGYTPGRRLRTMGGRVFASAAARQERRAILQTLSDQIGESCNIAVPSGDSMTYAERVETEWPLQIRLAVGTRVPLSCTASGKMFLAALSPAQLDRTLARITLEARTPRSITDPARLRAELDMITTRDHSEDAGELIEGMVAIAVPLRAPDGQFLGTVSFHAPELRITLERGRLFLPVMRHTALAIANTVHFKG